MPLSQDAYKITEHWDNYWKEYEEKKTIYKLNFFQYEAFNVLSKYVEQKIKKGEISKILNYGCGLDRIALHLKLKYRNNVDIYLLDISPKCLKINKNYYNNKNIEANYLVGDIFNSPLKKEFFDFVYNTGVLEHFTDGEKSIILKNISPLLKSSGKYFTFNPSEKGKIYKIMKKYAENAGKWKYGRETPIKTLKYFNNKHYLRLLSENDIASLQQLYSIQYIIPFTKYIIFILSYLTYLPPLYKIFSYLFGKFAGYYIIMSVFQKNRHER
jgi:2-polyprenyl-3-methyl-5-hydroxy-6-metoxy-1,4-benzoquinol methylase